jgi:hypothetical protein
MKRKSESRPNKQTPEKQGDTPLTDSWRSSVPKDAEPGIFPILWHDGFAMGYGTVRKYKRALRIRRYDKPRKDGGKKLFWTIEGVDYAEDRKTVLRIWGQTWYETEEQAKADFPKFEAWVRAKVDKLMVAQAADTAHKSSTDEEDLQNARMKVMREQYPNTFSAMDSYGKAQPEMRAAAWENVLRSYATDMVRLYKPTKVTDILPFKSLPDDTSFILEIAKAFKATSPRDPVDVEIAARWFAGGYDKMSKDEYTAAINAKAGANLKPGAMEKRRYEKLGLMTKKRPGPSAKS